MKYLIKVSGREWFCILTIILKKSPQEVCEYKIPISAARKNYLDKLGSVLSVGNPFFYMCFPGSFGRATEILTLPHIATLARLIMKY